jgi:ribulose-phosphate 3-epimerase
MNIKISASALSADLARLGEQAREAEAGGADWLHVDVMDGRFVPWLTFGAPIVKALKGAASLPLDVHLLTVEPERLIPAFAEAGADIITVQVEACTHLYNTVRQIKDYGIKAGAALNPGTPMSSVKCVLEELDLIMVLAVDPGYKGMPAYPKSIWKVQRVRRLLDDFGLNEVDLQVDGGIKAGNIADYAAAGATAFVAGSAVFNDKATVAENIAALREQITYQ